MKIPIVKIGEWKLFGAKTIGITIFPFIFLRKSYFDTPGFENIRITTINHESIHIKQQLELLIIPFYLWYFLECFIKFFKFGFDAYYHISFEKEAYANENNLDYLSNRKFWSFFKYIFN